MAGHKPSEKKMKKEKRDNKIYGGGMKREAKGHGGEMYKHGGEVMKGSQPMYSEDMPKAKPN